MAVSRYTIAVPRRFKRDGEQDADFVSCVAFGKTAEFAEKYFRQGTKIVITGRIQTGSYTNRDGQKVYTTDVIIEDQEFAESKSASGDGAGRQRSDAYADGRQGVGYSQRENESYQRGNSKGQQREQPYRQQSFVDKDWFKNTQDSIDDELPFH